MMQHRTCLLVIAILCLLLSGVLFAAGQIEDYTATFTVKDEKTYDFMDVHTYTLKGADGSVVVIMGDMDLPFIKALHKLDGKKANITLGEFRLESISKQEQK